MMEKCLPILILSLPIAASIITQSVNTTLGWVRGRTILTRGGRVVPAFFGIPFAKPPVGRLRFEPPKPADPWRIERLAILHAKPCSQIIDPRSSEDCLYLDVYTHEVRANPLRPVLVYFYGGFNEVGAADAYTPEYLMDEEIVYVIIQYRLGLFGFLSTGDEVVPGNMAMKDLRAGLRWVQANIANFGGDPAKVTIFGESAGAALVTFFQLYAADEGLFRAAISHSGSALCPWALRPPVEVKKTLVELSTLSSCPSDSVGLVDCLRAKPAAELVVLYEVFYKNIMYTGLELLYNIQLLPLLGGVLEPECAEDRFVDDNPWHRNSSLPWLLGANSKESIFAFILEINDRTDLGFRFVDSIFDTFYPQSLNYQNSQVDSSNISMKFRDFYMKNEPINRANLAPFVEGNSDSNLIFPTYQSAVRSNSEKTFFFYYDYIGVNQLFPIPPDARIGACHTDELYMFFPHPGLSIPVPRIPSIKDTMLSKKLVRIWVNFVTYLNPTPPGSTEGFEWTPFHPLNSYLHIKQDGQFVENQFLSERMKYMETTPYPVRDDNLSIPQCKSR